MCQTLAQGPLIRKYDVDPDQSVIMNFKYPKLITIESWDQQEINITAEVSINKGLNNDAFDIVAQEDELLTINSIIKDFDRLPKKIVIKHGGNEYFFNTENINSPEVQKFLEDKGLIGYEYMNHGVIKDIYLSIKVPNRINLEVNAKYGMVEVESFSGNMDVNSRYGGVDVSIADNANISLEIKSKFGDVYSNLDTEFSSDDRYFRMGRWSTLFGELNSGQKKQELKSEFGNIYIRKL